MTTPVVRRCPDGHYRRVIFDIGPFIADYPEQVLLAGIVQGWCPRCVFSHTVIEYHWDIYILSFLLSSRCTSLPDTLDTPSIPRRQELTDELLQVFNGKDLWDMYGIDEDLIVSSEELSTRLNAYIQICPALHKWLSSRWYTWVSFVGHSPPSNKGDLQGSPSRLGWWISRARAYTSRGCGYFGRNGPKDCSHTRIPMSPSFQTGKTVQTVDRWWFKGVNEGISSVFLSFVLVW